MKKIVSFLVILIFLVNSSFSQTNQELKQKEPVTKIGAFLAKKGKLIVKDFYKLGTLKGKYGAIIELSALIIYEPGHESERMRGLKIEITESGRYEKSNSSFLDVEEVDAFVKSISYLSDASITWKKENKEYSEVIFSTKDDFSFGFYQKENEQNCFAESGYIGKASCFFEVEDFALLKEISEKAKIMLSQK